MASSISSIMLYGKGVFTTVAIQNGEPFAWTKHWARLLRDSHEINIDISEFDEVITRKSLAKKISSSLINDGRARITFMDERPSKIWAGSSESAKNTVLHIIVGERRPVPENFKLTISPYPINSRSPLAGVKSCNYLENILTLDEAKNRGFDEAIRLNEKEKVTSAAMANVFWLKDDALYTPSLTTSCLAGTTREYVLENLECHEVEAGIDELNSADAIYLTSAGLGITSVVEYNGRQLHSAPHPINRLLTMN